MNATYIAIGCAFIAIGAGAIGRGGKAADETARKNSRMAGGLMILAGLIFAVTGWLAGQ